MNWQPIETAPKEGTKILVGWWTEQGHFCQGEWVDKGRKWACTTVKWEENTWSLTEWGLYAESGELCEIPTHWMPLPPPPSDEEDTFTAHGLTWRKHTPGDPMPCDGVAAVRVLLREEIANGYLNVFAPANGFGWWEFPENREGEIIGWNYAD